MLDEIGRATVSETAGSDAQRLPSVDRVLRSETGRIVEARFGHKVTVSSIRRTLAAIRKRTPSVAPCLRADAIAAAALELAIAEDTPSLRPVFNLTGTVLHTNL